MTTTPTLLAALAVLLLVGCGPAAAPRPVARGPAALEAVALPAALEIELVATGGFSPWSQVRYAVEQVRGQPMLVHERVYHGGFDDGAPPRRTLLDAASWAALHEGLEACRLGALAGPGEPPPSAADQVAWRWQVRWRDAAASGSERVVWLSQEEAERWPCLAVVEAAVAEELEPIAFARVFVAESERGRLDVRTVPTVRVYVDGVAVADETPVWGLVLPAGSHEVRLVNEVEGIDRRLVVVVEQGMTTLLELELRR